MANPRKSNRYTLNSRINVTKFDLSDIDKDNIVNHFLVMEQSDVTYSLIMELFGDYNGSSFVNPYDIFTVPAHAYKYKDKSGKEVSNESAFDTTFGIWIFNVFFIRGFDFCRFFGYINKELNADAFEDINQQLVFYLAEDKITTETYTKFLNYTQFFMPFENVLATTYSEEVLLTTKKIEKKKKELLEANKEAIEKGDFAKVEEIETELLKYVTTELKDDPGIDVYISGSGGNLKNNFKNIYIMKGAVRNPDPTAAQKFNVITSNYVNGIAADEYSTLANSLAAGPYGRAKKTEQGGYWEKLFGAALQSISIDAPGSDCGSKQYITVTLDKKNKKEYLYNYILDGNNLVELTSDNIDNYLNKPLKMRFSIYCKSKTGICNKCAGNLFNRRGVTNIGLTCVQIPTVVKLRSMKSFHDSTIVTTEIDPMKAFSLI